MIVLFSLTTSDSQRSRAQNCKLVKIFSPSLRSARKDWVLSLFHKCLPRQNSLLPESTKNLVIFRATCSYEHEEKRQFQGATSQRVCQPPPIPPSASATGRNASLEQGLAANCPSARLYDLPKSPNVLINMDGHQVCHPGNYGFLCQWCFGHFQLRIDAVN